MRGIDIEIRNPRLRQLIAFRRLDRQQLIALADRYYFPSQLIDSMCDFLELKLLEILTANGTTQLQIETHPIPCRSTDELKQLLKKKEPNPIYLTDEFMSEYFDRLSTPMTDSQLKFYDKLFAKIS